MAVDNLSAVLHGKGDIRLEQTPIEEPLDDDVQLRIGSVGICGTDLHYFRNGRAGPQAEVKVDSPIVLGHETSGTVTKVGKDVKHLKVGDRVAVGCHTCEFCKRSKYNLCPRVDLTKETPYRGHLRRYAIMKADLVFKVPDSLSMNEAALVEPFAVAVHACRKGHVTVGQKVLVCGAGPIGQLCTAAAKAYGVNSIVQTDTVDAKLAVATSMGADHTINTKDLKPEQIAEKVQELLGGAPDITFECTGQQTCLQTAVYATKPGGTILVVGMGSQLTKVLFMEAFVKEIVIQGIFCYADCYPTAIFLLGSGRVNLKPMIPHPYPLEEVKDAFDHAISKSYKNRVVKIFLNC